MGGGSANSVDAEFRVGGGQVLPILCVKSIFLTPHLEFEFELGWWGWGGGLKFTEFEAFRIRVGFEVGGMVTGKRKTPKVFSRALL